MSSLYPSSTIKELIGAGKDDDLALGAPERPALTYKDLRDLVQRTVKSLNAMGIGRNDRIAMVLPNGPEMAASFIAIAAGATTAPLNPAYRGEEFDFYLSDLGAKALVILEGMESPAIPASESHKIPLVTLKPGMKAGDFTLHAAHQAAPASNGGYAGPDDIALVLHTSGTTSRPKIVPLSQTNVTASAASHRRDAGAQARRHLPQHHAAVSYSRADRRDPVFHLGGARA
jgi:oxalate---CoA ligase